MQVMLGIRFRGGDIAIPFVDLVRSSQPITSSVQVEAICDLVRQEFAVFKPLKVRFYQPAHLEFQLNIPGSSGDKRVLTAPLTTMIGYPKPDGLERVTLRRTNELEFYPHYAETYAAICQEHQSEKQSSTHAAECSRRLLAEQAIFGIFISALMRQGFMRHVQKRWRNRSQNPRPQAGSRGAILAFLHPWAGPARGCRLGSPH